MVHLAESVGNALLSSTATRADQMGSFQGAGVYAIYYAGSEEPYEDLGVANEGLADGAVGVPIYVGKADPPGTRKGEATEKAHRKLYERLHEHRTSIDQATNLDVTDFFFRWLIVEPIWVPLGEQILIQKFAPVWNRIGEGFGKHQQGGNRNEELSPWDTLHPGRFNMSRTTKEPVYWTEVSLPNRKSQSELQHEVREHLASKLPSVPSGKLVGVESLPTVESAPETLTDDA
jgi:hypothetical protein